MNWILGRRWHVIQCTPRSELVASYEAKRIGWETFAPYYIETKRIAKRKPVTVRVPYIPGYIFAVASRYNDLHALSKCQGVNNVLRTGMDYALIGDTDPVMCRLLAIAEDDGEIPQEYAGLSTSDLKPFKAGDTVKLIDCPLALQPAVIEMLDDDRKGATVWVNMFGGSVKTHVKIGQMEAA